MKRMNSLFKQVVRTLNILENFQYLGSKDQNSRSCHEVLRWTDLTTELAHHEYMALSIVVQENIWIF